MNLPYLSLPKKITLVVLTVLLCFYIGFSIYLKDVAKNLATQMISTLKTDYPQIKDVTYQSTNFSPYDFIRERFGVNGLSISFNDSDAVLHVGNITVSNFMGLSKDPFGSFDLSFDQLTVSSLQDLYTTIATWSNNSILYSQLGNIPNHLDLAMNGDFNYIASTNTLNISLTELKKSIPFFTYQTSLSPLPLSHTFLTDPGTFLSVLDNTAIQSSHYDLNINDPLLVSDVSNTSPLLGNFLQNLNYTVLPLHMDITSDYQGGQKQETFQGNIKIQDLGDIHLEWTILFDSPPTPYNLANLILNPGTPQFKKDSVMIQSADITYTDRSFMPRLFTYLSGTMNQPVSTIQDMIQNVLTSYAAETDIPQFTSISNELSNFIANPGTLAFNLNPAKPFSLDNVATFFSKQQKLNKVLSQGMSHLSDEQKARLFKRYEATTSQAYSDFFNQIGLSVIANQDNNSN